MVAKVARVQGASLGAQSQSWKFFASGYNSPVNPLARYSSSKGSANIFQGSIPSQERSPQLGGVEKCAAAREKDQHRKKVVKFGDDSTLLARSF